MKQEDFERLVISVKQAGAIRRGHLTPERTTAFRPRRRTSDSHAIRPRKKSPLGRGAA